MTIMVWIGVALLSVSWLFGLGYYHPVDLTTWAITVVAGTACLLPCKLSLPHGRAAIIALLLVSPAVLLAGWPLRVGPLLIVVGLVLHVLPRFCRVPERISSTAVLGGCLLLAQRLAMFVYAALTARSHELPPPLPNLLGTVSRLLGIETAVFETTVALHSMRKTHLLGATWELLLDPASFCFLVAGAVLLVAHAVPLATRSQRWRAAGAITTLMAAVAVWLPIRAGLLMSLFLHQVLRTEYDEPLTAMRLFWNSWLHLALLLGPVVLAWRLLPRAALRPETPTSSDARPSWRQVAVVFLGGLAVALITAGVVWEPTGARKQGRVVVEEFHPDPDAVWERTDKPFDTEWYGHMSGYNYYCIYDYCSRFFHMSRLTQPIDDVTLRECDVLIIKVPKRPYTADEIRSLRRFVQAGGGLMLIGEHTNVFHTTEYLNPIAAEFGFRFREDCLFGIDSVFEQRYDPPPLVPHPIVQHMPPLDFATSCSIQPTTHWGRTVIRDTGLKNLMADYHADNFYPVPNDDAQMRYGAFVQLWVTRHGQGRVVAFSDSTIFSNFSTFEPGKSELMLGMIQWLNHRAPAVDPRPWLLAAGTLLLLGGLWAASRLRISRYVCLAAGIAGWCAAAMAARTYHAASMPPLQPQRPFVQVVMDRTVCSSPLPTNGFIGGQDDQFGIFERWILRLGYFTCRRQGEGVFDADLVVFPHPDQPVSSQFLDALLEYVTRGGKVLVIDSQLNEQSSANELLHPFGLAVTEPVAAGTLETADGWPSVAVDQALAVRGGIPWARLNGQVVAATVRHGDGQVVLLGFGSRLADRNMGSTGDVEPDETLREVYQLQFNLLRSLVEPDAELPAL